MRSRSLIAALFLLLSCCFCACSSGGGEEGDASSSSPEFDADEAVEAKLDLHPPAGTATTRDFRTAAVAAGATGSLRLQLGLGAASAFQVAAERGGDPLTTISLVSPTGDKVLDSSRPADHLRAMALRALPFPERTLNILNYPTMAGDSPLTVGVYAQEIASGGAGDFSFTVSAKHDPSLERGSVRVNVFYTGEFAQRASLRPSLRSALEGFRSIFAAMSVTLVLEEGDVASETETLIDPTVGTPFYTAAASQTGFGNFAVNLFLGADVEIEGRGESFGKAPFVPGPALLGPHSAVAIGLSEHDWNGDDAFDGPEIVELGETIAHEVGHYLGLFHPVEVAGEGDGFTFVIGDALTDTGACANESECAATGVVQNFMYPIALADQLQQAATREQSQVVNLQVVTD